MPIPTIIPNTSCAMRKATLMSMTVPSRPILPASKWP